MPRDSHPKPRKELAAKLPEAESDSDNVLNGLL